MKRTVNVRKQKQRLTALGKTAMFPTWQVAVWQVHMPGQATVQALSFTVEVWVQPQPSPCGICGGQSGKKTRFVYELFSFTQPETFHPSSIFIHSSTMSAVQSQQSTMRPNTHKRVHIFANGRPHYHVTGTYVVNSILTGVYGSYCPQSKLGAFCSSDKRPTKKHNQYIKSCTTYNCYLYN